MKSIVIAAASVAVNEWVEYIELKIEIWLIYPNEISLRLHWSIIIKVAIKL
jgi:hypothetical protein